MITLKNISKSYNNSKVLNNINLNLPEKGLICILGTSGSGKSTLLNIIGKIESPDSGEVLFYNKNIKDIKNDFYHTKYVSFIYQNYNLIEILNVKDNLNLVNKNNEGIINKLKLNKVKKSKVSKLSGGEQQRTAIARCILTDSLVYLADEPTGALDTTNSINIMKILKEISKEKLVLMITHNEELAQTYADNIIHLKDGKLKSSINIKREVPKSIEYTKKKVKFKDLIKIAFNYLKEQKIRNALTILATTIGLTSLALVLSMNNGLKSELKNLEKNALYSYPIVISKEKITINMNLKNNIHTNEIGLTNDYDLIKNKIDNKLLNLIKNLENVYVTYYRQINDQKFLNNSYIIPNNNYFSLIKGRMPEAKEEVLILLNSENSISESLKEYLDLKEMSYNECLEKTIKVNKQNLKIVGIVKSNDGYFSSLSGILYKNNLFQGDITDIHIYPQTFKAKENVKQVLKDYQLIDDASSAVNITKTLVNTITITLTIFSLISLVVSIILITTLTYINVLEKNKDIGIFKTLGMNKRQIKKIFLNQNYILSIISSLLSIVITILLSLKLNSIISTKVDIENIIKLNLNIAITITIISLFITKIGSIIPITIAVKKKIIDNLHNN